MMKSILLRSTTNSLLPLKKQKIIAIQLISSVRQFSNTNSKLQQQQKKEAQQQASSTAAEEQESKISNAEEKKQAQQKPKIFYEKYIVREEDLKIVNQAAKEEDLGKLGSILSKFESFWKKIDALDARIASNKQHARIVGASFWIIAAVVIDTMLLMIYDDRVRAREKTLRDKGIEGVKDVTLPPTDPLVVVQNIILVAAIGISWYISAPVAAATLFGTFFLGNTSLYRRLTAPSNVRTSEDMDAHLRKPMSSKEQLAGGLALAVAAVLNRTGGFILLCFAIANSFTKLADRDHFHVTMNDGSIQTFRLSKLSATDSTWQKEEKAKKAEKAAGVQSTGDANVANVKPLLKQ